MALRSIAAGELGRAIREVFKSEINGFRAISQTIIKGNVGNYNQCPSFSGFT